MSGSGSGQCERPDVPDADRRLGGLRVIQRGRRQRHRPGDRGRCPASVLSQPNPHCCTGSRPVTTSSCCGTSRAPACKRRGRLEAMVTRDHCPPGLCLVTADQRPSDIQNYTGIRDTPLVLGAVLGAARGGDARPRAAGRGAAAAARPGAAQDPRPAPVPAAAGGVLAGHCPGRGGAAGRAAARPDRGPLGLAALRRLGRGGARPTCRSRWCCWSSR